MLTQTRLPGTSASTRLLHLAGGLVGEGDGQDVARPHALLQQLGDAAGDDPGLAAAGPGQDQQRALDVRDGRLLGGGQVGEQVGRGRASGASFRARVVPRIEGPIVPYRSPRSTVPQGLAAAGTPKVRRWTSSGSAPSDRVPAGAEADRPARRVVPDAGVHRPRTAVYCNGTGRTAPSTSRRSGRRRRRCSAAWARRGSGASAGLDVEVVCENGGRAAGGGVRADQGAARIPRGGEYPDHVRVHPDVRHRDGIAVK